MSALGRRAAGLIEVAEPCQRCGTSMRYKGRGGLRTGSRCAECFRNYARRRMALIAAFGVDRDNQNQNVGLRDDRDRT